jgi:hypothetical protein
MKSNFRHIRCLLGAFAMVVVAACGGHSVGLTGVDAAGTVGFEDAGCAPEPCPSSAPWNPVTCSCDAAFADAGLVDDVDGTSGCPAMPCPSGSVLTHQGGACFCLFQPSDAGAPDSTLRDATPPSDTGVPDVVDDENLDVFQYFDAPYYPYDGQCYSYYDCGPGYALSASCTCEPCTATCPNGEMPGTGCNGCIACTKTCPTGFDDGPSCSCVPHGTEAGPMQPPDAGGVTCRLGAYQTCSAGAWCELGVCQDGKTQYGCYCNADGTATCSLTCPVPPSCTIPGQAAVCPPGRECVYGSCSDPSAELLVCQCSSYGDGGSAYCYTTSCGEGGPYLPDAGTGDVTCMLEGYTPCSAGSWCSLGTCPDGTQYGCTCNADGTATCDLNCPPPPSCNVPGEGTCPYGTSCIFGCSGAAGTGLSCYCEYGGSASCSTISCSAANNQD